MKITKSTVEVYRGGQTPGDTCIDVVDKGGVALKASGFAHHLSKRESIHEIIHKTCFAWIESINVCISHDDKVTTADQHLVSRTMKGKGVFFQRG